MRAVSGALRSRGMRASLAAVLLLSTSSAALHAQDRDLQKELDQLKAQINSLKAAINEQRVETRHTKEKLKVVAERPYSPPLVAAVPEGATPLFVTANKKIQFGAITITPGGFAAMEGRFATRNVQADIGTQYSAIPFGPQGNTNELVFSARQSRIAALIEAPISSNMFVAGYGEFDFLGSGATSNRNESDSFVPRIRHLYATLDNNEYGMHVLAGQTWSLLTMNSKGITPRNEVTPPTIDAQYVPGFVWKRHPQIRLTKDFNEKLWFSVSAEEAQTTFGTACAAGVNGAAITSNTGAAETATCALGGNANLNGTAVTNFSVNRVPDVVGKVAYEARLGDHDLHLEGSAIYRDLYDRVAYANGTAANYDTTGYGFGGGLIAAVIPKRLDFQVSGLVGKGIGSYGTAQFGDTTFGSNGNLSGLREQMLLAGLTLHATPSIDLYAFGGVEQVQPDYYTTNAAGTAFAGYGAPNANNSGCYNSVNGTSATCGGNAKRVWQVTAGMWDKIYKGNFGEVRVGLQYSYTQKELFAGNATTAPAAALVGAPRAADHSVLTSLRYYPFQ
jgi:hypothetical protein